MDDFERQCDELDRRFAEPELEAALEKADAAVDNNDIVALRLIVQEFQQLIRHPFLAQPLLERAIEQNRIEAVAALLDEGSPANTIDELGGTPLMVAAHGGRLESVRLLLRAGADPNVLPETYDRKVDPDDYGHSALFFALQRRDREVSDLLSAVTRPEIRELAQEALERHRNNFQHDLGETSCAKDRKPPRTWSPRCGRIPKVRTGRFGPSR
jgi:hypothetical protein